jgi:hypothetical protein
LLELIEELLLVGAQGVAAGFDFDADGTAVAVAESDNVGDAATALGLTRQRALATF